MPAASGRSRHLPLHRFRHAVLKAIEPAEYVTCFYFERPRRFLRRPVPISIGVESSWVVRDSSGQSILSGTPSPHGSVSPALSLVGQRVLTAQLHPPSSFVLTFASTCTLEIFVSDGAFESFSIPEANVYV